MDLSTSFDLFFLILAILATRSALPRISPLGAGSAHALPPPPIIVRSTHSTPCATPLPQSASTMPHTPIPRLTLTVSPASSGGGGGALRRPNIRSLGAGHGRKSVSFSLSSMDDLLPSPPGRKRHPPTPYVRGPVSPSVVQAGAVALAIGGAASPVGAGPGEQGPFGVGVNILGMSEEEHSFETRSSVEEVDGMGVKKEWLLPGKR